jgi:NifB/MoaA-like Fe-S oxidoreductase
MDLDLNGMVPHLFCLECGEREECNIREIYGSSLEIDTCKFDMLNVQWDYTTQEKARQYLIKEWNRRSSAEAAIETLEEIGAEKQSNYIGRAELIKLITENIRVDIEQVGHTPTGIKIDCDKLADAILKRLQDIARGPCMSDAASHGDGKVD